MFGEPIKTELTVDELRAEYRRLGLSIFESFEEYCEDKLESDEH